MSWRSNDALTPPVTEGSSRDTAAEDGAHDAAPATAGFLGEMQGDHDSGRSEIGTEEQRDLGAVRGLGPTEKSVAARECKRLLDRGRQAFLEWEVGLRSEMLHFVGKEVTPENALLLGFR